MLDNLVLDVILTCHYGPPYWAPCFTKWLGIDCACSRINVIVL